VIINFVSKVEQIYLAPIPMLHPFWWMG